MKNRYATHFEVVAKQPGGMPEYCESPAEMPEGTLVALVKVVTNNGKEVSRDAFVPNDAWMTVEEYYNR